MKKIFWLCLWFNLSLYASTLEEAEKYFELAQKTKNREEQEQLLEKTGTILLNLIQKKVGERFLILEKTGDYYYFKYKIEKENSKKQKLLENAIKSYYVSLREKEENANIHGKLAEIFVFDQQYDKAIFHYEKAFYYDKTNYLYLLGLAFCLSEKQYWKESLLVYEKLLQNFPKQDIRIYINTLELLKKLAEEEENPAYAKIALQWIKKIEEIKPNNYEKFQNPIESYYGYFLFLNQEKEKAEKVLLQVISRNSEYAMSHYFLGILYYTSYREKPEEAILKKALLSFQKAWLLDKTLLPARLALIFLSPTYEKEIAKWKEKTKEEIRKNVFNIALKSEKIKKALLERINEDRLKIDLKPLEENTFLSLLGQKHALEQQQYGFVGAWGKNGFHPYLRYSMAGGNHSYKQEIMGKINTELEVWGTQKMLDWIADSYRNHLTNLILKNQARQTIFNPHYQFLGIGLAFSERNIFLTYEYEGKYIDWEEWDKKITVKNNLILKGKVKPPFRFLSATLFYEPLPAPLSLKQLRERKKYTFPKEYQHLYEKLPLGFYYQNNQAGEIEFQEDGTFSIPIIFYKQKGIYTLLIRLLDSKNQVLEGATLSFFVQ